jgi:plasmid stabilization system protein ParE
MDFTEARKPAIIASICETQVDQAVKYLEDNYAPKQAALLRSEFLKIVKLLEIMPGLGTKYKNGMRKANLGKFRRYNIYYKESETNIEIVGIWHTSRGTDFEEP